MYHLIDSDNVIYCDVDDTLVIWNIPESHAHEAITFDSFGYPTPLLPHLKHIELLKQFKVRGHTVVVWSQGGREWAKAVVDKLGLQDYVDYVGCKPKWIIDDLPANAWTSRTYLDLDGKRISSAFVPQEEKK